LARVVGCTLLINLCLQGGFDLGNLFVTAELAFVQPITISCVRSA
jgi:hypothetical protein